MLAWIHTSLAALGRHLFGKAATRPSTAHSVEQPSKHAAAVLDSARRGATTATAGRANSSTTTGKPLRIIQWIDSSDKAKPEARRMVMSGRFADICAELERLSALESA